MPVATLFSLSILLQIYPLIAQDIEIVKHGSLRLEVRFKKVLSVTIVYK